ncbi:hypothetical protein V3C99_016869 [Haemonchus contortus]|uniref:Uncharacterized protein n=1 Tax=Haemonchus contortus TaxID=6289 RepID=A0A7I4Z5X8_HAECO
MSCPEGYGHQYDHYQPYPHNGQVPVSSTSSKQQDDCNHVLQDFHHERRKGFFDKLLHHYASIEETLYIYNLHHVNIYCS